MKDDNTNVGKPWSELAYYFAITYTISWLLWSPYYAGSWFPKSWHTSPFFHFAGALGPCIGAFVIRRWFGKKSIGTRASGGELLLPALTALLLPFLVLGLSLLISYLSTGHTSITGLGASHELPNISLLPFLLLNVIVIGVGEEAGWRGFALPLLQARFSALNASLLLSIGWALWHWPLFFYPNSGFYSMAWMGVAGWVLSLILGSVLLTWLFNWSKGSMLVCALFHGTMDITFTAPYVDASITSYNGMLITLAGVLVILVFKPTHLSPVARIQR